MTNACLEALRWAPLALAVGLAGCAHHPPAKAPPPAGSTPDVIPPAPIRSEFRQALTPLREGAPQVALPRLEAFTERHPQWAGGWYNLGLVRLRLDDPSGAREALERAMRRRPRDARIHNALGVALRRLGRLDEAQAAYRRAIELDPAFPPVHRNLGILLDLYLGRPEEALAHYHRYRDLAPTARSEVDRWLEELGRRLNRRARAGGEVR